ncbi:polysaccharide deacetylase family protein [Marinilactibacillus kalidii]|uniref:polysaccharide deacetylase family protein n=1 Tax=Marinilactibacillus kalidii TaxID=2820274 RepID=UPI001ABE2E13|nr:polysaccharide deacetylase family protein [Marinilactibacillus kalidii]
MFTTLLYHEILPCEEILSVPRPISVADGYEDALPTVLYNSYECFCEQMNYLIQEHYHFLTLKEVKNYYKNSFNLPKKAVLITFDDCFQSQMKYAYPFLKDKGIPAVSFEAAGWVFDHPQPYEQSLSKTLSFPELKQMKDVFTYANHSYHFHQRSGRERSRIMWESKAAFIEDVNKCNDYVQEKDVYAYPFGLYNKENVETLTELGFTLAFTTVPGINTKKTNPLELHREVIPEGLSLAAFREKLGETV